MQTKAKKARGTSTAGRKQGTAAAARGAEARAELIRAHFNLVHHVAHQVARSLSTEVDFDELVSAGSLGLIQAIESFDPSRGFALSTLAVPRIRGAMLDELRRLDHVPRTARRHAREMNAARERLAARLGQAPTDGQMAEELGIDKLTLWRWEAALDAAVRVPLERASLDEGEAPERRREIAIADETPSVEDRLTAEVEQEQLREALSQLKEQERTVLSLYYFEELKMHEIATMLGLTESRIAQVRTRAVGRLRALLAPLRDEGFFPGAAPALDWAVGSA